MTQGLKRSRTHWLGLLLGAFITLLVVAAQYLGLFESSELRTYDLRFRIRGPMSRPADIMLVTIDETTRQVLNKSLSQISRLDYASLIEILSYGGARLVVFDIDFASNKEGDESLAQTISCSGAVIMSSFIAMGNWVRPNPKFSNQDIPCPIPGAAVDVPDHVLVEQGGLAVIRWKPDTAYAAEAYRVYFSVEPFDDPEQIPPELGGFIDVPVDETALELTLQGVPEGGPLYVTVDGLVFRGLRGDGAVNIIEDTDDRVRRIPLVVGRTADDPEKSAALSLETAVRAIFGEEAPKLVKSTDAILRFEGEGKALEVPLIDGRMLINFVGGRDTFDRVSLGEVIKGRVEPAFFNDKIVMVGNTHHLAHDEYPTPFGRQTVSSMDAAESGLRAGFTSGLEIHANALHTILSNDHIYPLSAVAAAWIENLMEGEISDDNHRLITVLSPLSVTLLVGLLGTFVFIRLRVRVQWTTALFLVMVSLFCWSALSVFINASVWAPVVAPLMALVGTYGGGLFYHVYVEGREKRWIKDTFGKYLAPSVVEQITRDPSRLELGGEEVELTAFFSDIQGFTSISEQLGNPRRLVELLNDYLSAMADIIEGYEGTIDKYEGDAVIAFWGAPIHFPDHALKACLAALDQQRKLEELREAWKQSGKWPEIVQRARARMGINTGLMVVGNMGSRGRMNYTMMGDAVNLAARLEGAGKQYGSYILISEDTYAKVKESVEVRELDTIRVVGKAKPVTVYELIARKGDLDQSMTGMRDAFIEGIEHYRQRNWDKAIDSFETALESVPEDGPSMKYIDRCRDFIKQPPPDDWDGVFDMKTK